MRAPRPQGQESQNIRGVESSPVRTSLLPNHNLVSVWGSWQGAIMAHVKSVTDWMAERGLSLAQLIEACGLEKRVVKAMVEGRYTASPEQRRAVAAALGVDAEQIAFGHVAQVEHIQGHGPLFGRNP